MRKVIGIGETVLDIIFKDNKPVTAVPGGSTFNAIVSLSRAGVPTCFLSEAGDDRIGDVVFSFLKDNGVQADYMLRTPESKSPVSLAFLDADNHADYIFYRDPSHATPEFNYPEVNADDIVIFGSFYAVNPAIRPQVSAFLEYAKKQGAILYYDVNFRPSHRNDLLKATPNLIENLEMASIVRGSDEDFGVIYKQQDPDKAYKAEVSFYCKNFICTQGAKPVIVHSTNNFRKEYPVQPMETVSTIGAGDNFNAGFIYGMIKYGVTLDQLQNAAEGALTETTWDKLVDCGLQFSADCCKDIYNYISKEFGEKFK